MVDLENAVMVCDDCCEAINQAFYYTIDCIDDRHYCKECALNYAENIISCGGSVSIESYKTENKIENEKEINHYV